MDQELHCFIIYLETYHLCQTTHWNMIIPYLRQDLEIFRKQSKDGAPAWLLYDAVRNKYLHWV